MAKKKKTWSAPIGGEKISFELISIGVKWPTIVNEKKVIRVTSLDMTKIHLSDFTSTNCEKTFHLKGPNLLQNFIFNMNLKNESLEQLKPPLEQLRPVFW